MKITKLSFFLLGCFILIKTLNAQTPQSVCFLPAVHYVSQDNVNLSSMPPIAKGDFNTDGIVDIVTADSRNIIVMLGQGDGTFIKLPVQDGGLILQLQTGDVNNDGKLDVLTSTDDTPYIKVHLGNGDGTFQSGIYSHVLQSNCLAFVIADFNGDAFLDIAAACGTGSATVDVLLGSGDGHFNTISHYLIGGSYPVSIKSGDLNGDHVLDIVTVNNSKNISVFLGNANGTFNAPTVFPFSEDPKGFDIGFLNQDDKLDLAIVSLQGNVFLYNGQGDGTFIWSTTLQAFNGYDVSITNLNNDYLSDLVVLANDHDNINVFLQSANGFEDALKFRTASFASALLTQDFNGDGKLDIATASRTSANNTVSILLSPLLIPAPSVVWGADVVCGNGTYTYSTSTVGSGLSYSWELKGKRLGDVLNKVNDTTLTVQYAYLTNGATHYDTLKVTSYNNCVTSEAFLFPVRIKSAPVKTGAITGNTTTCQDSGMSVSIIPVEEADYYLWSYTIGNGVVFSDSLANTQAIFSSVATNGSIKVLAANECGLSQSSTFKLDVVIKQPPAKPASIVGSSVVCPLAVLPYYVAIDNNADSYVWSYSGTGAIVSSSSSAVLMESSSDVTDGVISVVAKNTCGSSAPASLGLHFNKKLVATAIIGDTVLCAGNAVWNYSTVLSDATSYYWTYTGKNVQVGNTGTSATLTLEPASTGGNLTFKAYNSCGFSNEITMTIKVVKCMDGEGICFEPLKIAPVGLTFSKFNSFVNSDLNKDGYQDLIIANRDDSIVSILYGKPDLLFEEPVTYKVGKKAQSIIVSDFNLDGNADVATVNNGNNTVSILFGTNAGVLSGEIQTHPTDVAPYAMTSNDFNGDDYPDVAVTTFSNNSVAVLLNNGDGTFALSSIYTVGTLPFSVVSGDFNGDQFPDIAVLNQVSKNVSILLNTGSGTFLSAVNYAVGNNPFEIVGGDFTLDSIFDLAISNFSDNTISILKGVGDGSFTPYRTYSIKGAPSNLKAVDINHDYYLDLVSSNSDNTAILLNDGLGELSTIFYYQVGDNSQIILTSDFDGDGITDILCSKIGLDSLTLLSGFKAQVISSESSNTICTGEYLTLSALDPKPGLIYQWMPSGDLSDQLEVYHEGEYFLTVSNHKEDGCNIRSETIAIVEDLCIPAQQVVSDEKEFINVFPNPSFPGDEIHFRIAVAGELSVIFYDKLGKELYRQLANGPEFTIPGLFLPNGMYLIKIATSDKMYVRKFLVNK